MTHTAYGAATPSSTSAAQESQFRLTGNVLIFFVGIVLFATLALLPPLLQDLLAIGVPAGLVTAPSGIGTMLAMLFVGRFVGAIDVR